MSLAPYSICIVSPENYPHSRVFFEIAEVLLYSLKELGHPIQLHLNTFVNDMRNIVIGAHLMPPAHLMSLPENTIILNTEQLLELDGDWLEALRGYFRAGFEIWDYSEGNIDIAQRMGAEKIRLLRFGYQAQLNRIPHAPQPDVDVLFYGSINDRRRDVMRAMQQRGLNVKVLTGVYGKERDAWIGRSKIVLNMHYYSSQIFEVVRVFYLLTNGVAVLGEVNPTTTIEERFREGIAAAPFEGLVETAEALAKDPERIMRQRQIALESIMPYPQVEFTRTLV